VRIKLPFRALLVILLLGSFILSLSFTNKPTTVDQKPKVQIAQVEKIEGEPQPTTEKFTAPSGFAATSFPVGSFQGYTSAFGYRVHPMNRTTRFHYGLDISGPLGSPLYAWATGTVVRAQHTDNNTCGKYVEVKSGVWTSLYCHADSVLVNVGDQVKAGELIATLGTTGSSTGPHLHWGLKYDGQWVDPNIVLLEMKNIQS
jgi:murein DD-endopeptidase MepM/ murein hydrolase activator NlpD